MFHVKHLIGWKPMSSWFAAGIPKINLVSKGSLQDIWTRHILDSVQVYRCADQFDRWVDLGSGGGFPGMVCAIMAMTRSPERTVYPG